MSEELRPCPFHNCLTCACVDEVDMSVKDWNTRPVEDELRKRIAELDAAQVKAKNEIYRLNRRITELLEVQE